MLASRLNEINIRFLPLSILNPAYIDFYLGTAQVATVSTASEQVSPESREPRTMHETTEASRQF
jgi:hypothetical protein